MLAEAMAPAPDAVMVLGDKDPELMHEFNVCQDCYSKGAIDIAILAENASASNQEA